MASRPSRDTLGRIEQQREAAFYDQERTQPEECELLSAEDAASWARHLIERRHLAETERLAAGLEDVIAQVDRETETRLARALGMLS